MDFVPALRAAWQKNDSLLCVGLDPAPSRLPPSCSIYDFCRQIVDATADLVCAYKLQIAYFASCRAEPQLERLMEYIHSRCPGIPVILDAKRGDIGSTARCYAEEAFVRYGADAVTVSPYMGWDSIEPYFEWEGRGVILLCRTSNPGGADLQNLDVGGGEKLYERVARLAAGTWNVNGNCALVVGATVPGEIARVRALIGDMPLLVPGIGAQGGDIAATVSAGQTADGTGLIISSSRAILYAGERLGGNADIFAAARQAAQDTRDAINACRRR